MRPIRVRYTDRGDTSYVDVLGIDISKADFHAWLLQQRGSARKSFPNTPAGYRQLQSWLKNRKCERVHACMEATGAYWMGVATALYEGGQVVSVVNPSRTAMYARSRLQRTKTDLVDSEMIAQFCKTQSPDAWKPPARENLELRGFLSYRDELVSERLRLQQIVKTVHASKELQRLHAKQLKTIDQTLAMIEKQIRALLTGHPHLEAQVSCLTAVEGIGFITGVSIVAKLPMERLRNAKAAAAYVGLTPSERQSGTSVHGRPRICKTGHASLRRDLYMPALTAMRFNPVLREFAERLKNNGKPSKVVIVAVMRKLIVLAYALLRPLCPPNPAAVA